ncbi:MAG: tRNA (adenosine(37)-N6)-threonylcarbamoyltransferase complex dimerization subunit type 1 TsaB [Desulfobacterales bacterium]|nr:tRNA (adenosine(37)-N6)-threonylcarbamoyltransferase complex dimerization subunit type 1 TsaB [Desulfobacterales bacterium]
MKLLSVTTAEQGADIALYDQDRLVCSAYWDDRTTHSKRLIPMIEHAVTAQAGFGLEQVDAYVAARGPGSFTGLRIGISLVQGLAFSMSKPMGGVSSLDAIAWRFSHVSVPVCVMMDARRGEVYTALYRFESGRLAEKSLERVCNPADAMVGMQSGDGVLFVGSGSKVYAEEIRAAQAGAQFSHASEDHVSAVVMGRIVLETKGFFEKKENALLPTYMRKSDAEIQFAEKTRILTS